MNDAAASPGRAADLVSPAAVPGVFLPDHQFVALRVGSGTDTRRATSPEAVQDLAGQPVVVENSPAPTASWPSSRCLRPADGYTVFIGSNSTLAVNARLLKELPTTRWPISRR